MLTAMLFRTFTVALPLILASAGSAFAQSAPGLIRDAEIENTIRAYSTPLFKAAGLDSDFVQIYLVNSPQINAFVAGGQRLFINTGLLVKADRPNNVIGVIAHETGHIAGGHLVRSQEAFENASAQNIIGLILGAAAAAATGKGDLAAVGSIAGGGIGTQSLFSYSIGQEERADQAAVTFLDRSNQSAKGLLEFFDILAKEELLLPASQDPYLRTHPFTRTRVDFVRDWVQKSKMSPNQDTPEMIDKHQRMLAKLRGFLAPPNQVLKTYPETDKSFYGRYARSVVYHRTNQHPKAMAEIDSLVAEKPDDPYVQELRGQILFESGHVAESVPPYQKAVKALPDSALLRIELAQAELETGEDPAVTKDALAHLHEAVRLDASNADGWHQLAIAEGRSGNLGLAALALAEEGNVVGDHRLAVEQATRATQLLPRGTPGWIRADDIKRDSRNALKP